jgi:GGDEF domain-containing protein
LARPAAEAIWVSLPRSSRSGAIAAGAAGQKALRARLRDRLRTRDDSAVPPARPDRVDLAPEQACLTSGVSVVVVDVEPLATGIDTVVDQVLTALGRRLAGLVRPTDLVVRPWRTRFVLVLDGARDDYQLAGARRRITDALTPPVLMDGRPLRTSVLVGVVVSDPQDTVDAVLARLGSVATRRPIRVRRAIGVVGPPA